MEKKTHPPIEKNQVILACVYDALSAKIAERAGFQVLLFPQLGSGNPIWGYSRKQR